MKIKKSTNIMKFSIYFKSYGNHLYDDIRKVMYVYDEKLFCSRCDFIFNICVSCLGEFNDNVITTRLCVIPLLTRLTATRRFNLI